MAHTSSSSPGKLQLASYLPLEKQCMVQWVHRASKQELTGGGGEAEAQERLGMKKDRHVPITVRLSLQLTQKPSRN